VAAFFLNARLTPTRLGDGTGVVDLWGAKLSPPVAALLLCAAGWILFPAMWVAPVWLAMGIGVRELGRKLDDPVWEVSGFTLALLPVARMFLVNLHDPSMLGGVSLRLLTMGLSIAGLYVFGRRLWLGLPESAKNRSGGEAGKMFDWVVDHPAVFSWAATLLAFHLIWYEVTNTAVGLAWAMMGLALIELSSVATDRALALQGYALMVASFARIFFADLNAGELLFGPVSVRLLTVSILTALYYHAASAAREWYPRIRLGLLWFGAIALVALLRFELPLVWVAVGWSLLVPIYFLAGEYLGDRTLRIQAMVLALLAGARCGFYNFYQADAWGFTSFRTATILMVCVILYGLLAGVLIRRRGQRRESAVADGSAGWFRRTLGWMDANPWQPFFFIPSILLTILITVEVERGYMTAAWGLEGVILFAIVLRLGEQTFRWFSLALFLLAVARIVAVDIWAIEDPLGRIASFMGLGVALLVVSFLYARFRDAWRKYL